MYPSCHNVERDERERDASESKYNEASHSNGAVVRLLLGTHSQISTAADSSNTQHLPISVARPPCYPQRTLGCPDT